MAVIINELEVIVESPDVSAPTEPAAQEKETPLAPPMAPQDINDIMRHQTLRLIRVQAH